MHAHFAAKTSQPEPYDNSRCPSSRCSCMAANQGAIAAANRACISRNLGIYMDQGRAYLDHPSAVGPYLQRSIPYGSTRQNGLRTGSPLWPSAYRVHCKGHMRSQLGSRATQSEVAGGVCASNGLRRTGDPRRGERSVYNLINGQQPESGWWSSLNTTNWPGLACVGGAVLACEGGGAEVV